MAKAILQCNNNDGKGNKGVVIIMKYHKIRNVPLNVCTAEQKIAYNLACRYYDLVIKEYNRLPMQFQKTELINKSIQKIMELYRCNKTKYDEEDVEKSTAWYLFMWFVFTFVMLIASFTKPWAIRVVFFTLDLLFILLASSDWKNGDKDILKAAGIVGLICAISAIYAGSAEIINGAWGITILPLGAPGEKWLKKAEE